MAIVLALLAPLPLAGIVAKGIGIILIIFGAGCSSGSC
jgi:hypothetical protein